ncbi:hypothetical protein [Vibrio genomosp. F10]|uniref:hypothetical protein n=1 Tax=Vibrio genomosp. F10 TaxID=723171 RepID=UPI00031659BF|nr:hypothetical protein [Vibrio genomosp. F10]OEF08422.1 hypothetical protein A1QI_03935 [Vibrio genomosp. F10 str. 9ZB36]
MLHKGTLLKSVGFTLVSLMLLLPNAFASQDEPDKDKPNKNAFIQVNVSLDLQGIEESIDTTSQSLNSLADSLNAIATSPDFTPEQQKNIELTVNNVNQLIDISTQSLEQLPVAFAQSKQVVGDKTQLFLDDVKFKLILIVSLTVLALLAIIGCIYWLLLRPLQSTVLSATTNVSQMAQALQVTAKAVEACTEKQQSIADQLVKNGNRSI